MITKRKKWIFISIKEGALFDQNTFDAIRENRRRIERNCSGRNFLIGNCFSTPAIRGTRTSRRKLEDNLETKNYIVEYFLMESFLEVNRSITISLFDIQRYK